MASLVADYGSSSASDDESEDDQDKSSTTNTEAKSKSPLIGTTSGRNQEEIREDATLVNSVATVLDNPFRSSVYENGSSTSSSTTASVFSNPYREAENAEQSVLEKHVKMTPNSVKQTVINGRQVCWNYRKGRCRFGHNCKFAHDSDLPIAATLPSTSPPANTAHNNGQNVTNNMAQLPIGSAMSHGGGRNHRSGGYELADPDGQGEGDDVLAKKKKRPGLGEGLVPSKKVMKSFHRQQQQQRPWLSSRH